jgi:predicted DNA-binding transcriptional regulator YafY
MTKANVNPRQLLMLRRLIDSNASMKDILDSLTQELGTQSENIQVTERTFYRDMDKIRKNLGVDIKFDADSKVYYINPKGQSPFTKRLLKAVEFYKIAAEDDKKSKYQSRDLHRHFKEAEEVVLSFKSNVSNLAKMCPLHESQEIIMDNEKEFSVRLNLKITCDFLTELLSFGEQVMVLRPEKLSQEIQRIYQEALEQYYL